MKMVLLLVVVVAVIYMLHQQSQNCCKCVAPVNEGYETCDSSTDAEWKDWIVKMTDATKDDQGGIHKILNMVNLTDEYRITALITALESNDVAICHSKKFLKILHDIDNILDRKTKTELHKNLVTYMKEKINGKGLNEIIRKKTLAPGFDKYLKNIYTSLQNEYTKILKSN